MKNHEADPERRVAMRTQTYFVEHNGCGGKFVFDRYGRAQGTFYWFGTCTRCQESFCLDVLEYYLSLSCNDKNEKKPS